jgi:two-component system osmolarity sensor histidine kinase EnvZ
VVNALIGEVVGNRPRVLWMPIGHCVQPVNAMALRRILGNLIENALRYSRTGRGALDCSHRQP